jgi:type IV conjugative transfer system lipoprotein TraV
MKRAMGVAILLIGLAGCADNFSCQAYPRNGCRPISAVNANVDGGLTDYRAGLYANENAESTSSESTEADSAVPVAQANRALNYAHPGDPVLSKPQVLRILVSSWEDEDKDLNAGGYIYVRVRDSEWMLSK